MSPGTVLIVTDPLTGYLRVKAICVFAQDDRILAVDAFDPVEHRRFWVPIGGRVEFGETTRDAIAREVREELDAEVRRLRLLGVLENIFTFGGAEGHEIVFVYDGEFSDRSRYAATAVGGIESNGQEFVARWIDPRDPDGGRPVYPDGLTELLG